MLFWDGRFFNLRLFKYFARIQNESTLTRAKKNVSVMYDIETYCTSEIIIFSIKFTLLCALQFVYHLDLLSNTGSFFFFSFICDTALWSRIFIRFIIEVFFFHEAMNANWIRARDPTNQLEDLHPSKPCVSFNSKAKQC